MEPTYSADFLMKMIIIGDTNVGKTSFLLRAVEEPFPETYIQTIGVEIKLKALYDEQGTTKTQLWDVAGHERFRNIVKCYYKGTCAAIILFDITNLESFLNVEKWLGEYKNVYPDKKILLVGNKCDLEDKRAVSFDVAQQYATTHQMKYIENSAKETTNAKGIIEDFIREVRNESFDLNSLRDKDDGTITLKKFLNKNSNFSCQG